MEKHESDISFIARWTANELSDQELTEFKKTDAYKDFNRINIISQGFKGPKIDKETALLKIKVKMKSSKIRKLNTSTWYSIAASIAIIISVFYGLNSTKNYTTTVGEQLAIILPDGSSVALNANSSLNHKRFFWNSNRQLNLQGEAYFKVKKGSDFVVTTNYGNVTVLGTKFNIKARNYIFELNCFEGKVRFDKKDTNQQQILIKDEQLTIIDDKITTQKSFINTPGWTQGISIFKDSSLQEVLYELSSLYNITFEKSNIKTSLTFSGSFVHNNLDNALKTTLTPMGIIYTISKDKTVIYLQ
jgi:ferric-dicitrate binding protein FerR (iron transport regulator)